MSIWIFKTEINEDGTDDKPANAEFIARPSHGALTFPGNGSPLAHIWEKPLYQLSQGYVSDFPYTHDAMPLVSLRVMESIREIVSGYVEFLPVDINCGEYYIMNCTYVIDALDLDKSELTYSRFGNGKISSIEKYVFFDSIINNIPIFKIPQRRATELYINDCLTDIFKKYTFTGFLYDKIY